MKEKLTLIGQIGYACGMLGYSILFNIISVMLIYFYLPPNHVGLKVLVPQITVFGIFTLLSLIVASGRLLDAITDPLIAYFSDKSKSKKGRRIPFMVWSLIPCCICCVFIFLPRVYEENVINLWYLAIIQIGFYLSLTFYIVPYNALLPELAQKDEEKVILSAWLSGAFVLGIIISSQTPGLADFFQKGFAIESKHISIQWAIMALVGLSAIFLLIPILTINEQKHCIAKPATIRFLRSLKSTLSHRNFMIFVISETLYFVSLTIIVSGMLYYLSVLLRLEEALGGKVMGVMVILSLLFYPLVVKYVQKVGKKKLMFFSLAYLSLLMGSLYFMGKVPIPPKVQIFGFAILGSLPLASLGILPYAIIAELAQKSSVKTGQQREAMYFAVRNLSIKFGQTFGIMIFAILTLFGKDPGDDLGIRLSGVFGFALCALAALTFSQFKERRSF